jgi:tRNA-2-methylthio-N6-dimethylallyladenosine synthase
LDNLRQKLAEEFLATKAEQDQPILHRAEKRTFAIETYGCQMNVSDSEVVRAILLKDGWTEVDQLPKDWSRTRRVEHFIVPDLTLINTCAIRDNAENKIWSAHPLL